MLSLTSEATSYSSRPHPHGVVASGGLSSNLARRARGVQHPIFGAGINGAAGAELAAALERGRMTAFPVTTRSDRAAASSGSESSSSLIFVAEKQSSRNRSGGANLAQLRNRPVQVRRAPFWQVT